MKIYHILPIIFTYKMSSAPENIKPGDIVLLPEDAVLVFLPERHGEPLLTKDNQNL